MKLLEVDSLALAETPGRRSPGGGTPAQLEDVSFSIGAGESLALVIGEEPARQLLLESLLLLRPVDGGRICVGEIDTTSLGERQIRRLRKKVQGVFSDEFGQLSPGFTVDEMFAEVLRFWFASESRDDWRERTTRAMVACGLPEAIRVLYPSELDAVERQLVALARSLLIEPELLVLGDYTRQLDAIQEAELLNRVRDVREDFGLGLIVLTDDLAVAHQLGDAIGVFHDGRLVEIGPGSDIVDQPAHPYTRLLVNASIQTLPNR